MLIPCCSEKLPARLEVAVLSAKNLPVMDKSNSSTDAFVEVHFGESVFKSEVISRSLNPHWEREVFVFDTDERQLLEEGLQLRVMDHDTYSANDAIGRVNYDCNLLVERLRLLKKDEMEEPEQITAPIYDTLNGLRGELTFEIRLQLLVSAELGQYVQFISRSRPQDGFEITRVIGLISDLRTASDPEFEWLDRIRTPRATNETRQTAIRATLKEAASTVAFKAHQAGANAVLGYHEYIDVEGESSDLFCVRVFGTAVYVEKSRSAVEWERVACPLLSLSTLPEGRQIGVGALVSARAVHLLNNGDDASTLRKSWWNELRAELYHQATRLGCNLVIGYSEQTAVNSCTAIYSVMGTAVLLSYLPPPMPPPQCSQFHSSFAADKLPFPIKLQTCALCKEHSCSDLILSTTCSPAAQLLAGPRLHIQFTVTKKLTSNSDDEEDFANDISNLLPFVDHELYNGLLAEAKTMNPHANALYEMRSICAIADGLLVVVATAVLCRLTAIQKEDVTSPSLANVLSFPGLQKVNDNRRFSWGTVRDAMRLPRQSQIPIITLKVLHLRFVEVCSNTETPQKRRSRIDKLVGKLKRRQHEKELLTHVLFERQLSAQLGLIESGIPSNGQGIAGIHAAPPGQSLILNRDQSTSTTHVARWENSSPSMKESTTGVDANVSQSLEEAFTVARAVAQSHTRGIENSHGAAITNAAVASAHLTGTRDHSQLLLLITADLSA